MLLGFYSAECHRPEVSKVMLRDMITRSDVARGSPGSLEAWKCNECKDEQLQSVIDLTLDSDVEEIESELDNIQTPKRPVNPPVTETEEVVPSQLVEVAKESVQQAHSNFKPYRPSAYIAHLTSNNDQLMTTPSKLPFFSQSPRRTHQSVLFGTSRAPPNSLRQWIKPIPITPKASTERSSRKKNATRLSGDPVTMQLKGLSDWVSYKPPQ